MIGSISKVRPCGHHHYYKYAHVTNTNDFKKVNANYKYDTDNDGYWYFCCENWVDGYETFNSCPHIKKFNWDNVKNLKNMYYTFARYSKSNPTYLPKYLYFPKVTNATHIFSHNQYDVGQNDGMTLEFPIATGTGCLTFQNHGVYSYTLIAPKTTDINNICNDVRALIEWKNPLSNVINAHNAFRWLSDNYINTSQACYLVDFQVPLKKVTTGSGTFYNRYTLFELKFPIDEDGNCIYESKKPQHIINGIPQFDYMTLPKLSNGTDMFHSCILDKPSALSVLNSLPSYTSGTHNFNIGIDIHLQYDPEVNLALKKVDVNYEPTCSLPIDEETGEETMVTSGKGWNLTVEWNGPYNSNLDELKQKLQFDTIVLPDGYTRLEYLQTRRFNYIDTEYTPSNTTGLYLMAKIPFYWPENNSCIFGSGQLTTNNCFLSPLWARNTVQPSKLGHWKSAGYNLSGKGDGRIYEGWLNYNNSREARLTVDGEEYSQQNLPEITASTKDIIMFGYRSGSGTILNAPSRIYRAQITEGAELVRDFIPCLNPEGEPCMYDIIQGKEYNNAVPEKNEDFIYKVATN